MGGYGAFKWGMQHPDQFKGIISMSGALDLVSLWKRDPNRTPLFNRVFGSLSDLSNSDNNLISLFSTKLQSREAPHFLQICGTEDFLYQDNQTFKEKAENKVRQFSYKEYPGGHTWTFWDQKIQDVLQFCNSLLD